MTAPEGRRGLRVADADRQAAADRLTAAHDEGRLDFLEYDDRLARAYRAVSYGDLDDLFGDLPAPRRPPAPAPAVARPARSRRRLPTALRVLWTIWASIVALNLTVWVLVSVGNGRPDTFWPMWLLVPGAVLVTLSASIGATRLRETRGPRED